MPLVPSTLASGLESLFDEPPLEVTACASQWATALSAYAASIVPPSTQVASAASAFEAAIATMDDADQAQQVIQSALGDFADIVGAGMQPAFTAVAPVTPWSYTFSNTISASSAADAIASSIDTWLKTGMATNVGTGVSSSWS